MGTGVGEAMLIGAAVGATAGGAGAAIQGGDPLQGALMGGAMGGIGGGLAGAFPGAAVTGATPGAAVTGATPGAAITGAAPGAAVTGATPGAATGFVPSSTGLMALPGEAGIAALPSASGAGVSPFVTSSTGLSVLPGEAGTAALTSTTPPPTANIFGYMPGEKGFISNPRLATIGGTSLLGGLMQAERNRFGIPATEDYVSSFDPSKFVRSTPTYAPESVYVPQYRDYTTAAEGGIMKLAAGGQPSGPVERMSMMGQQPGMYPQGMINAPTYAVPSQRPASMEIVRSDYDTPVNPITGIGPQFAEGGITDLVEAAKAQGLTPDAYQNIYGRGNAIIEMEKRLKEGKPMTMAGGGISSLGGYSDGGRMLKGPGDGMSDSIPGVISGRQPARLADGEFVVPADVVSHLGNGSTDAGAKQLYSMMDKVRKARTGKKAQGKQINPRKYMPA